MQSSFTNVYFSSAKSNREIFVTIAEAVFLPVSTSPAYRSIEIFFISLQMFRKHFFCFFFVSPRNKMSSNRRDFRRRNLFCLFTCSLRVVTCVWAAKSSTSRVAKNTSRLHHRARWELKFETRVVDVSTTGGDYAIVCTSDYPKRVFDFLTLVLLPDALQCRHCLWSNSTAVKSFWVQTSRNFFFH